MRFPSRKSGLATMCVERTGVTLRRKDAGVHPSRTRAKRELIRQHLFRLSDSSWSAAPSCEKPGEHRSPAATTLRLAPCGDRRGSSRAGSTERARSAAQKELTSMASP